MHTGKHVTLPHGFGVTGLTQAALLFHMLVDETIGSAGMAHMHGYPVVGSGKPLQQVMNMAGPLYLI